MKIKAPNHGTAVAYLALFAALGGTAIAARSDTGANELKHLVVRENRHLASADDTTESVVARCHRREQFISGYGGWSATSSALPQQPTVVSTTIFQRRKRPPSGISVFGSHPAGFPNTLTAQALCLPK
jgi:hypothetical protein